MATSFRANSAVKPQISFADRSYADVLKQKPNPSFLKPSVKRVPSYRRFLHGSGSTLRCFRCGGANHWASACREPLRCFRCGCTGHKQVNCSPLGGDSSKSSSFSMGEAWLSMIYHDESSIPRSAANQDELCNEQFDFNSKYLKLRKSLILANYSSTIAQLGLLDGMFNSCFKIGTIASYLLDTDLADGTGSGEQLGEPSICLPSSSPACWSDVESAVDPILLDPVVQTHRYASSNDSVPSPARTPAAALPLCGDSAVLCDSLRGAVTVFSSAFSELPSPAVKNTGLLPLLSTAEQPVCSSCTELTLYNRFNLLESLVEEEPPVHADENVLGAASDGFITPVQICTTNAKGNDTNQSYEEELLCPIYKDALFKLNTVDSSIFRVYADVVGDPEFYECGEKSDIVEKSDLVEISDFVEENYEFVEKSDLVENSDFVEEKSDFVERMVPLSTCYDEALNDAVVQREGSICVFEMESSPVPSVCCPCGKCHDVSGCASTLMLSGRRADAICSPEFPPLRVVDSCVSTPYSGKRRGRKKKGFYECSSVRRSARLGSICSFSPGGGYLDSGADSISESGSDCWGSARFWPVVCVFEWLDGFC